MSLRAAVASTMPSWAATAYYVVTRLRLVSCVDPCGPAGVNSGEWRPFFHGFSLTRASRGDGGGGFSRHHRTRATSLSPSRQFLRVTTALPISWELLSLEHLVECSRTRIRTTIGGAKASQILLQRRWGPRQQRNFPRLAEIQHLRKADLGLPELPAAPPQDKN